MLTEKETHVIHAYRAGEDKPYGMISIAVFGDVDVSEIPQLLPSSWGNCKCANHAKCKGTAAPSQG